MDVSCQLLISAALTSCNKLGKWVGAKTSLDAVGEKQTSIAFPFGPLLEFIYFRVRRLSVAQNIQRRGFTKQLIGMGVAGDCRGVI